MTMPTDIGNWRKCYVEKSEILFGKIALKFNNIEKMVYKNIEKANID